MSPLVKALVAAAAVLLVVAPWCQADPASLGRASFLAFTDKDGLPQNTVVSMTFDRKGYLWAGTFYGAACFKGHSWSTVNMPTRTLSNDVRAILSTSDGAMWFGTYSGGLHRLKDGKWTTFSTAASAQLPDNQVRALLEVEKPGGSRALWVGTLGGVAHFDGERWDAYRADSGLPSEEVWSLIEATSPDGTRSLLAGTSKGLARFDGRQWAAIEGPSGAPLGQVNCLAETVSADGARSLWVGTEERGVWRLERGAWTAFGTEAGLPDGKVNCLLASSSGPSPLWVGTTSGLARLEGGRWASAGLISQPVRSLAEAAGAGGPRTLWVGTDGGGLARLRDGQWTVLDTSSGLKDETISCFLETAPESGSGDPVFWIGTDGGGLARVENDRMSFYDAKSGGLPNDSISALAETTSLDGRRALWVGTAGGGLARLEGGSWTVFDERSGLPNNNVWTLLPTRAANGSPALWVGTYGGGLARYESGLWSVYNTKTGDAGLPNDRVWSLLETEAPDGTRALWVGTAGGGLARLLGGRWTVFDVASSGLPNNGIWCLQEFPGPNGERTLWAGTDGGGVARLDLGPNGLGPGGPEAAHWSVLSDTSVPALPNNLVYQVRRDARGRVYLFTNKGVARLTPRTPTADAPSGYEVYTFTVADGLPSNECAIGASFVDAKGRVWAGTIRGAAVLDPSLETEDRGLKPLYLEQAILTGRGRLLRPDESLAYDENHVAISYTLLSYFRENETRYRTQLVGLEDAASEWSPDTKREYTALPEGSYVFRVWGRDYAGNVSGPAEIAFEVRPAPWRTWWAYLGYSGALALAVFGGVRLRLGALRRRNRELEARIAERTAELAEAVEQMKAASQTAIEAASQARSSERKALEAADRAFQSEKAALESQSRAVEANRAKSVFLANMSHELRTPLNAILGFTQLMRADGGTTPEQRESLGIISRSGEHLLGLINDVLSISKIEAGKVTLSEQAFDLGRLLQGLEEMVRMRAESKGLHLLFDIAPDLPRYVWGDEGKLRQVLINLLGNAVKFTDSGGVALRATWRNGGAGFEVEDTGHGIAEEEIGRLFEPFVQTESGRKSTEGTGLGLAISHNFVQLMGGEIRVRSALGKGTIFSFAVPLAVAEGPDEEPDARRVVGIAAGQRAPRVLVADDKWENRALLIKILVRVGIETREAVDGREAVDAWTAWRPDLIWMDMRMPTLDGMGATREIRAAEEAVGGDRCAIVALTASVFEHDRDAIIAAGCDDFVAKPFREAVIFEKMTEHLGLGFVYEEVEEAPAARREQERLTTGRLSALPRAWLVDLHKAMVAGDPEVAHEAIDLIAGRDEGVADELRAWIRGYRYDDIQKLVEAALSEPVA